MIRKLRMKFIAVNMGIVTTLLCILFGTVYHVTQRNLENDSIRMLQSVADKPNPQKRPGELHKEVQLPFFTLKTGQDGELMAVGGGYFDLSDREYLQEVLDAALAADAPVGVLRAYNLRFYRVDAAPGGHSFAFADISSERATLEKLLQTCVLLGAASLVVLFIISAALAAWAIDPVARAWEQQKQFVADASHELKTPLTILTTNAELLQQSASAEENAFVDNILTTAQHMRTLVTQLLDLARSEQERGEVPLQSVDLSALAAEAAMVYEVVLFEKGLQLTDSIAGGITVPGEPTQLRQLLDILLDNAGKYSTPGGTVQLGLDLSGAHRCCLWVANPGEPLSQEDLHRIFQRFYRVDEARTHTGSYGLGLAIAQNIVSAHRGKIWATSQSGSNTFFVELPLKA